MLIADGRYKGRTIRARRQLIDFGARAEFSCGLMIAAKSTRVSIRPTNGKIVADEKKRDHKSCWGF